MVLVVSEALEDLRATQIRKRGANAVYIPTEKKVGNDIVHTDSCAFDPRVSTADSFGLHDVAIVRCGFHEANYITTFRKIDIQAAETPISRIYTNWLKPLNIREDSCNSCLRLLFLAEFLESGLGAQRIPERVKPKKGRRNDRWVKPTVKGRLCQLSES
jgi:hypothetical protein